MDKGKKSAIVIGAGIVGLASARALAQKGYAVKVFDRSMRAVGASIRNFGMLWPIGQPTGKLYDRAIRSLQVWKDLARGAGIWFDPVGSLVLAYHSDEWEVLQELHQQFTGQGRAVQLLQPQQVAKKSGAVVQKNLLGGLFSPDEVIIDPREAIGSLPAYLAERYLVEFHWGKCVTYIADQTVYIGNEEEHSADLVIICSGADFETLYPEHYAEFALTKCKLQMMRLAAQPGSWRIGPALLAGLSLVHYASFQDAPSLSRLRERFQAEKPEYLRWGIHVMVSQNGKGELTVGDSHEYGLLHDPFNKEFINRMILDYLKHFAHFREWTVVETWNGILPKLTDGDSDLFYSPEPGIYLINGLGGAGMTLSFGLTEELIAELA
jgi:FAD dependent oxidoreductase TIGR03364